jgi:virginiamycin B lyase
MSEPRTDRDVERALTAWMDHVAPPRPPSRILERTFVQTMQARQLRRYPWNAGIPVGAGGRTELVSRATLVLVVVGVLLAVVAAVALVGGGQRPAVPLVTAPSPTPTAVVVPSPSATVAPSLPAAIPVPIETAIPVADAMTVVGDDQALWVMAPGRIDRIDPSTDTVTGSVPIGDPGDLYNGVAVNASGVWATNWTAQELVRVNATTLKVAARIPAGLAPKGVLANADGVWVADTHGGTVLPIDQTLNRAGTGIKVAEAANSGPNWFGSGEGSIWVGVPNNSTVARIDPGTNTVTAAVPATGDFVPCGGIAVDAGAVWITGCSAVMMAARIDPATNTMVATIDLHGYGSTPTVINGKPWLSVQGGEPGTGFLARIDPGTNTIDRVLVPDTTFGGGGDMLVAAGSAWVVDGGRVLRLPLAAFGAATG